MLDLLDIRYLYSVSQSVLGTYDDGRLLGGWRRTQVHDVISANGAVVDDDVPCPQRNRIPLHHKSALLACVNVAFNISVNPPS